MGTIQIVNSDITILTVDIIVTSTNNRLTPRGGLDGDIHSAAGAALSKFCRNLFGCETGQVVLTPAFQLDSKYLIHTVGPIWQNGHSHEPIHLKNCYTESLKIAHALNVKSIAFPAVSCGLFGYPISEACSISYSTIQNYLIRHPEWNPTVTLCSNAFDVLNEWNHLAELTSAVNFAAV